MPTPSFFRIAAAASLLTAFSTVTLIFPPDFYPPRETLAERMPLVALFLLLAALLRLKIMITEFGGPVLLPEAIGKWAYPAIQPAGRFIIALWLWRFARSALCGARSPQGLPAR